MEVNDFQNIERISITLQEGLTVIGGKNRQGKTAVVNAARALLAGKRSIPADAVRHGADKAVIEGSLSDGSSIRAVLSSDGYRVSMKDAEGNALTPREALSRLIDDRAVDLTPFLAADLAGSRQRLEAAMIAAGIEDQLTEADKAIERVKSKASDSRACVRMLSAEIEGLGAVAEPKDAIDIDALQAELIGAGEWREKRHELESSLSDARFDAEGVAENTAMLERDRARYASRIEEIDAEIEQLQVDRKHVLANIEQLTIAETDVAAFKTAAVAAVNERIKALEDYDAFKPRTQAEIIGDIEAAKKMRGDVDRWNRKQEIGGRFDEAKSALSAIMEEQRAAEQAKADLLCGIGTLIGGVSISEDQSDLQFNGVLWPSLCDTERIVIGIQLLSKANPECGFMLYDGIEKLDPDMLAAFRSKIDDLGIRVLATRVTVNEDECTFMMNAGQIVIPDASSVQPTLL